MRPNKKSSSSSSKRANRTQPINPNSSPRSSPRASASLLDSPLSASDDVKTLDDLQEQYTANPRSFPYSVKQQCWGKAERVKGRDPDRWRRDPLGNLVFRKLVGCAGCLCHDYDHIVPFSKMKKNGAMSMLDLNEKKGIDKVVFVMH